MIYVWKDEDPYVHQKKLADEQDRFDHIEEGAFVLPSALKTSH